MATVDGYSLQDMAGNEFQRMETIPNPMQLPNGDQVFGATPGWDNGTYKVVAISWEVPDPPVMPDPVPPTISNRQFYQALAFRGTITTAEALGAVKTGTMPKELQKLLDAKPSDKKFTSEMMLAGATAFERNDPGVIEMMTALGYDAQQTDDFWRYAFTL